MGSARHLFSATARGEKGPMGLIGKPEGSEGAALCPLEFPSSVGGCPQATEAGYARQHDRCRHDATPWETRLIGGRGDTALPSSNGALWTTQLLHSPGHGAHPPSTNLKNPGPLPTHPLNTQHTIDSVPMVTAHVPRTASTLTFCGTTHTSSPRTPGPAPLFARSGYRAKCAI